MKRAAPPRQVRMGKSHGVKTRKAALYTPDQIEMGLRAWIKFGSVPRACKWLAREHNLVIPDGTLTGWLKAESKQDLLTALRAEVATRFRARRTLLAGDLLTCKNKIVRRVKAILDSEAEFDLTDLTRCLQQLSTTAVDIDRLARLDEGKPTEHVKHEGEFELSDIMTEMAQLRRDPRVRAALEQLEKGEV